MCRNTSVAIVFQEQVARARINIDVQIRYSNVNKFHDCRVIYWEIVGVRLAVGELATAVSELCRLRLKDSIYYFEFREKILRPENPQAQLNYC